MRNDEWSKGRAELHHKTNASIKNVWWIEYKYFWAGNVLATQNHILKKILKTELSYIRDTNPLEKLQTPDHFQLMKITQREHLEYLLIPVNSFSSIIPLLKSAATVLMYQQIKKWVIPSLIAILWQKVNKIFAVFGRS